MSNTSSTSYPEYVKNRFDPAIGGEAIDYSGGDQDITFAARGVYVGTAGHLKVDLVTGDTVTFSNLTAGNVYPFAIKKIYQTGSSAAGVILR